MLKIKIICFTLLLYPLLVTVTAAQDIFEVEKGLYSTRELESKVAPGAKNRLIIKAAVNLHGRISLKATEQANIGLIYTKQARTDTWSKAMDYIDLISVSMEVIPEGVRLELRAPNPAPWNSDKETGLVETELTVPAGFLIEIDAIYFDVYALGPFKGLVIDNSLGRYDITGVTDILKLSTANRRVNLTDIGGEISVATTNAPLVAKDIKNVKGQAVFRNDGGDIKIDGFVGEINAKNNFGQIRISNFIPRGQSNYIRGFSGPVILEITEMIEGQLVITNRYEDIDISVPDTLSAFYSMVVDEEGVIEAANFPFTADLIRRNRLNLTSGEGDVEISGTVRGKGNIYIRGIGGK
ncbi:MAG: hypothetical protein JXA92_01275 [candidate division Zixibacteria bacterium]|nr:hypothetical protein [candidate division Zixibacteria bacterium]